MSPCVKKFCSSSSICTRSEEHTSELQSPTTRYNKKAERRNEGEGGEKMEKGGGGGPRGISGGKEGSRKKGISVYFLLIFVQDLHETDKKSKKKSNNY